MKLHSYYIRISVRFELIAIAFEHIEIIYNNGDEINSEFGRSVFLLAPQLCAFATSHLDIVDGLKCHRQFLDGLNLKDQNLKDKS